MEPSFTEKYRSGKVRVRRRLDTASPNAFDEAIKGASGIAHDASPVMQSYNPKIAVPILCMDL
jgi:hypothetical protein